MDDPPPVVILTTFDLDDFVFRALQAGAAGFLLKDTPPLELVQAVRVVAGGESMLSPSVTRRLIDHFAADPRSGREQEARARVDVLTERELEVLVAVGRGRSNAEVGAELFMSEATVKAYVSRLLTKLDLTNRVQLAILAHDAGLQF
jgi:DNA-binding NarL/FixJ family response regulator